MAALDTRCTGAFHLWAPSALHPGWLQCARAGCTATKVAPMPPVAAERRMTDRLPHWHEPTKEA